MNIADRDQHALSFTKFINSFHFVRQNIVNFISPSVYVLNFYNCIGTNYYYCVNEDINHVFQLITCHLSLFIRDGEY